MKVFFLGISGTLMGNIALMAKELGHDVIGVDDKVYPPMSEKLKNAEVKFKEGFVKSNFSEADIYIVGNVISKNNELMQEILNRGKSIQSSPDWLFQNVLANKKVIAVSGTHGKTSVTTLIAHALENAGLDPSYLIAGVPNGKLNSWRISSGEHFVIEADEYDSAYFDKRPKFFHYKPKILLINNIEFDHGDIYSNIEDIEDQFLELIESLGHDSIVLISKSGVRKNFLGLLEDSTTIACKLKIFDTLEDDLDALNKNLAKAVLFEIPGIKNPDKLLKGFFGVQRRFEYLFESEKFVMVNDFAHHPTAIEKTLDKALSLGAEVYLIVEIGSNTMKSGYHDSRLKEIFQRAKTFLVNPTPKQKDYFDHCIELTLQNLNTLTEHVDKKRMFLMCGNKNFNGLQEQLLKTLLDTNI
ncbi:MAG: Mur ligase family protein [Proteobacteria bacterium]|nr:Mur ligase family protein [Pseudomonadota bacterium]MDA0899813.1 Mur ligase family protein [Pseudomonadota bacterium]